jgi:outer membrane lipase/esterase
MSLISLAAPRVRRLWAGAALVGAAVLAACGGGTSQFEPFAAERYFAFGDETSVITPDGRKYAANVLRPDGQGINCTLNPSWVQLVARVYGFSFEACPEEGATEFRALMRATAGAQLAEVNAQIDAQAAAGGFSRGDLATLMVGSNDVLALYAQYPARSVESLVAEARERGRGVGRAVNRMVDLGARVIVATIPDMGLTPFALAEKAAHNDIDRAELLSQLSSALNEQLGVTVLLDGRFVGLVQADLIVRAIARAPFLYGVVNVTDGICTVPLPDCTTATVRPGTTEGTLASPAAYLWADDTRLGYGAQVQLGNQAVGRARGNPF